MSAIVNIAAYRFVTLDDAQEVADRLYACAGNKGLLGTILVAPEGLNLFLAGRAAGMDVFLHELRSDARFAPMRIKTSHSAVQPFGRLKVKVKPEIIAFRRGVDVPSLPSGAVSPATLRRWIAQGKDDTGRPLVLLDTRNREETAYGTFAGALTLPIDNFMDLPDALAPHRESLQDAAVVSFCTGGVRCEKLLPWLQAEGMENFMQLDGGILGYFEEVGGEGYEGDCFVFDERMALDPQLRALSERSTDGAA